MDCKTYYDKPVIFPQQSFIAFIFYVSSSKELHVVMRKEGKQYRYTITNSLMDDILAANNRASFIAQNIFNNKDKYPGTFVQIVPAATIEQVTLPRSVKHWLRR